MVCAKEKEPKGITANSLGYTLPIRHDPRECKFLITYKPTFKEREIDPYF